MAYFIRVLGRLTGRAVKSHAFDRAITAASVYIVSEMKLADLRAKRSLLRRKRSNHLRLLGKTVYRLIENGIEPLGEDHVRTILRVLDEIGGEIGQVEDELARRRDVERERRRRRYERKSDGSRRTSGHDPGTK